jgi:hypothetical protein
MRSQYIILATIAIIFLLFYIFYNSNILYFSNNEVFYYSRNFENELSYISENFNKSYIGDFLKKFSIYMNLSGHNFSFVCISPIYLNIPECNETSKINCCYYFDQYIQVNRSILLYCNKNFVLYNKGIICICYNISGKSTFYSDFICI